MHIRLPTGRTLQDRPLVISVRLICTEPRRAGEKESNLLFPHPRVAFSWRFDNLLFSEKFPVISMRVGGVVLSSELCASQL